MIREEWHHRCDSFGLTPESTPLYHMGRNHYRVVMKKLPKPASLMHAAIVVLFFLGNAGFTAVIHSCVMQSSGCPCSENPYDSKCEASRAPIHGLTLKGDAACHVRIVAGGLPNLQGLHEQVHGEKASKVVLVLNPLLVSGQGSAFLTSAPILSSFSLDSSPLSGEKYVLHEALRI